MSQDEAQHLNEPHANACAPVEIRNAVVAPAEEGVKVGRYDWIIGKDTPPLTPKEKELREGESKEEESKTKQWKYILDNWAMLSGVKNRGKIQELISQGIPDAMRSSVWKVLLEPRYLDPIGFNEENMDALIAMGAKPEWGAIEADLGRTMPRCPMFNNEKAIGSLRRVLCAYSNKDKELGYISGMSFFAAFLLLYMDEKIAFHCFLKLMTGEKHQWRLFFLPGFQRLIELNNVWEVILKEKYPKIYAHFDKIGLTPLIYTPSWFLTAFLNIDFPIIVRLRILDDLFEFGTKTLLSFAIAVISRHKVELAKEPIEHVMTILQRPHATPNTQDWRYLLKKYKEHFLSEKEYARYFSLAKVQLFP